MKKTKRKSVLIMLSVPEEPETALEKMENVHFDFDFPGFL